MEQPAPYWFEVVEIDDPEATSLLDAYETELRSIFTERSSQRAANHPEDFRPPTGVFLLLRDAGRVLGCGGVRRLDVAVGELKRMYLDPEARGIGLGARLLRELEARAADLGYRTLRLDSRLELTAALRLYRAAGYHEIAPYNDNDDAQTWMERSLPPRL